MPFGRTTLRTPKSCCLPEFNNDTYCSLNVLPERDDADTMVFTRVSLGYFEITIIIFQRIRSKYNST